MSELIKKLTELLDRSKSRHDELPQQILDDIRAHRLTAAEINAGFKRVRERRAEEASA